MSTVPLQFCSLDNHWEVSHDIFGVSTSIIMLVAGSCDASSNIDIHVAFLRSNGIARITWHWHYYASTLTAALALKRSCDTSIQLFQSEKWNSVTENAIGIMTGKHSFVNFLAHIGTQISLWKHIKTNLIIVRIVPVRNSTWQLSQKKK